MHAPLLKNGYDIPTNVYTCALEGHTLYSYTNASKIMNWHFGTARTKSRYFSAQDTLTHIPTNLHIGYIVRLDYINLV